MTYKVFGNRVLIQVDDNKLQGLKQSSIEMIESGKLHIAEKYEGSLKKVADTGTVLELGNQYIGSLKVGDRVKISQFSFAEFPESNLPRTRIFDTRDVLAEVEEDKIYEVIVRARP